MTISSSISKRFRFFKVIFQETRLIPLKTIPVLAVFLFISSGCASHGHKNDIPVSAITEDTYRTSGKAEEMPIPEQDDNNTRKSEEHVKTDYKSEDTPVKSLKERFSHPSYPRPTEKASTAADILSKKLETIRIGTLDFREEKLSNILKVITAISDINFAVKEGRKKGDRIIMPEYLKDVLEEEDNEKDKNSDDLLSEKVSIYLKDTTLRTTLDVLCRNNGLRYSVENGYILLSDKKEDIKLIYESIAEDPDVKSESLGFVREMELKGVMLYRALNAISKETGINIVCKPWLENIEVDLSLKDVSLRTAVELLCKKYNLWYRDQDNAIQIMHAYDLERESQVDFSIRTEVFNLKYASAPQVADAISSVMGDRVEYVLPTQLKSYEHLKLSDLDEDEGKIETQESDTESSKEIDTPDLKKEYLTSDKIKALLGTKLDLKLTSEDVRRINRQLGFGLMSIFLRNNTILVASSDKKILGDIGSLISQLDTPTPQVLVECRILNVTLTDDFSSFFQITDAEYDRNGGGGTDSKILTGSMIDSSTGINAAYEIINNKWKLNLKLEMLQKDGLVNTIATPMVVAAQNSEAQIASGNANVPMFSGIDVVSQNTQSVQTGTNPLTGDPIYETKTVPAYTTPEYETVDLVGTVLKLTPQINQDGSVTLKINLVQSDINQDGAEIQYATFDSEGNPNPTWSKTNVNTLKTKTLQTIAVVPKGSTLALGGLIEEQESLNERKVPILGDIPVIGIFFKNKIKGKKRTEMIVLLTPHILMVPTEAGRVTDEALEGSEHPVIKQNKKYMFEYDDTWKKLHTR